MRYLLRNHLPEVVTLVAIAVGYATNLVFFLDSAGPLNLVTMVAAQIAIQVLASDLRRRIKQEHAEAAQRAERKAEFDRCVAQAIEVAS